MAKTAPEWEIPKTWEIDFHYPDEEDKGYWRVCRRSGGVNDREWKEIGKGNTLGDAIASALAAAKEQGC